MVTKYLMSSQAEGDRWSWVDSFLFTVAGWPVRRLWSQELLAKTASIVAQMKSMNDWCSFNADAFDELTDASLSRWNPIRLNHASLFKGVAQEIASLELTVEVLKVKTTRAQKGPGKLELTPSTSSLCPQASWIHEPTTQGVVIRCTRLPEWIRDMHYFNLSGHKGALTYVVN